MDRESLRRRHFYILYPYEERGSNISNECGKNIKEATTNFRV